MTYETFAETIYALNDRKPFRPYTIELRDGKRFEIVRAGSLLWPKRESTVLFIPSIVAMDRFEMKDVARIIEQPEPPTVTAARTELVKLAKQRPFVPFRVVTEQAAYDVKHPAQVMLARESITSGIRGESDDCFETTVLVPLCGIVRLETPKRCNPPGATGMASDITEPATETDAAFARLLAELAARWHEETAHMSKMFRAAEHPAYQEIIAMGERAVPLLLAELESNGGHWFVALHRITGANPVPKEDAGRVQKMADAWIAWGRTQGYRWGHGV